eukprot:evm.model.scf_1329.3 EVM.evm.TU.scf_1329.3   scf_1329:15255-20537(+)
MTPNPPNGAAPLSEEDLIAVRKVIDETFKTVVNACEQGNAEGALCEADKGPSNAVDFQAATMEGACEPDDQVTATEDAGEAAVANGDVPSQPEKMTAPVMDCAETVEESGVVEEVHGDTEKEDAPPDVVTIVADTTAGASEGITAVEAAGVDEFVEESNGELEVASGLMKGATAVSAEAGLLEQLLKSDEVVAGTKEVELLGEEKVGEACDAHEEAVVEDSQVVNAVRDAADEPDEIVPPPEEVATELEDAEKEDNGAEEVAGEITYTDAPVAEAIAQVVEADSAVDKMDKMANPCDEAAISPAEDGTVEDSGYNMDASSEPVSATPPVKQPIESIDVKSRGIDAVVETSAEKSDEVVAGKQEGTAVPGVNDTEVLCKAEEGEGAEVTGAADSSVQSPKHAEEAALPNGKDVEAVETKASSENGWPEDTAAATGGSEKHHSPTIVSPKVPRSPPAEEGASKRRRARTPVMGYTPSPSPPPRPPRAEKGQSSSNHSTSSHGAPRFMQTTAAFKGKGPQQSKSKGGSKPAWVSTTTSRQDAGYQTSMQLKVSQINVSADQNGGSRSVTPTRDPHVPRFMQATHSVIGKYGSDSEGSTGRRTPGSGRKGRAPRDQSKAVPFY